MNSYNPTKHHRKSIRLSGYDYSNSGAYLITVCAQNRRLYSHGVKTKNWPRFEKRVWQLRYWDHIVRNESELFAIRQYIKNNPSKWESDMLDGGMGNRVLEESFPYERQVWMVLL
jgi:hypothetical protein